MFLEGAEKALRPAPSPPRLSVTCVPATSADVKPTTRGTWGTGNKLDKIGVVDPNTSGPNGERVTTKGCICQKEWNSGGAVTDYCGKPDGDAQDWCFVTAEQQTCQGCVQTCSFALPSPMPFIPLKRSLRFRAVAEPTGATASRQAQQLRQSFRKRRLKSCSRRPTTSSRRRPGRRRAA